MNDALDRKRQAAICIPFTRRSCMLSALSNICVRERSFVVLASDGSVWMIEVFDVVRSL